MKINNHAHLLQVLDDGPYAWPGGYPLYFLAADGQPLSFGAVRDNPDEVRFSFEEGGDPCWRPIAVDINWEDGGMFCAHTNERIESAYEEDIA